MKITFLGSSHGVPEPNRRCSSILIEVNGSYYILDMGTQSIEQLIDRGIAVEDVRCIFISHMHGDHTNGLISFLDLCNWYYKKANPTVFLPGDLEKTKAAIGAWIQCNGLPMREFQFVPVTSGKLYEDENIRITAFQTMHTKSSYAFLLEASGKRVFFSGDLYYNHPTDFPKQVLDEPLDLAVCECAHFDATEYLSIFGSDPKINILCFNHYSDLHLPSILSVETAFPNTKTFRATDGTEITV